MMKHKPRKAVAGNRRHKMSPKQIKAGAAAMSAAMLKKAPSYSKKKQK